VSRYKKLTPKQEKFVQGIVAGLSQRQAYKQAGYSVKNKDDNYIDSNASRLMKNTKVMTRYRDLIKESSNMVLWSREQSFTEYEWLKNKAKETIQNEGLRKASSDAFLESLEGMNKMAFRDLELADKKLKAEIEKIYADIQEDDTQENKLSEYFDLLGDAIDDE